MKLTSEDMWIRLGAGPRISIIVLRRICVCVCIGGCWKYRRPNGIGDVIGGRRREHQKPNTGNVNKIRY